MKKTEITTFLKDAPKFSLQKWKRSETKVAVEYCWAISIGEGGLMPRPINFQCVGFSLDFSWTPVYTHTHTHMYNWPYVHSIQTWGKLYLWRIFRNVLKVEMHYTRGNFLTGGENITVSKQAHARNWLDIWLTLGILLHGLPRGKDVRRGRWNLSQSCSGWQSTWPATGLMF